MLGREDGVEWSFFNNGYVLYQMARALKDHRIVLTHGPASREYHCLG